MRPTKATIDLVALRHNFALVKQLRPNANILAVIKANAYGHGAVACANALSAADGFAVASIEEAEHLFNQGIKKPIVLLAGFFQADELALICERQWIPVIHHEYQIKLLQAWFAKHANQSITIFLKMDTGMHRLGILPEHISDVVATIDAIKNIKQCVLMTHFACADEPDHSSVQAQFDLFTAKANLFDCRLSLANSALIMSKLTFTDHWVRPGIMLYGASPFVGGQAKRAGLLAVMTFSSEIISIRQIKKGERVGYGGDWQAARDSKIATIAMGYADGYPRQISSQTPVLIHGQRYPIVGRVSMDFITVDVTNCPMAQIGDRVIFWGNDLAVDEIAVRSNTIAYDLLTGVNQRVKFDYVL